ncbi:MAG: hypothetical protein EZS28_040486, partial [Streblomastix strix]
MHSGRLLQAINNAHNEIASVTTFYYSGVTISGELDDQLHVWKICRDSQQLVATMKELRMAVIAVHIANDGLECMINRSDGQMLSRQLTHYIRLKQIIKTANFNGMGNLQVKLQLIACGADLFSIYIDVSERQQFREEQQSDKELFDIAVDSLQIKFALVVANQNCMCGESLRSGGDL